MNREHQVKRKAVEIYKTYCNILSYDSDRYERIECCKAQVRGIIASWKEDGNHRLDKGVVSFWEDVYNIFCKAQTT